MEYYTIYKVTNKVNGKIYIGSHKTTNLDDGYMGSGKYLRRSIDKHGLENFEKEILFVFDNPEEMFAKEGELVNEDFLAEENTYNLKVGGFGGWDYINANPDKFLTEKRLASLMPVDELRIRWKQKYDEDPQFREQVKKNGEKGRQVVNELFPNGTFKGKQHTLETKEKMSEATRERYRDPTKNPQYGTSWYHNPETFENRKFKEGDEIPDGFVKGRKLKPPVFLQCRVCNETFESPRGSKKTTCSDSCSSILMNQTRLELTKKQMKHDFDTIYQIYKKHNKTGIGYCSLASEYNINKWTIYDYVNRYKEELEQRYQNEN